MEESRNRYILLKDRVGDSRERSILTLGLATKLTPTQLLKGELLEALPENEQPADSTRIALGGINRKLRVECLIKDVMKLTVEEFDLLLAISSVTLRYHIWFVGKRLDFGKRLEYGSQVLVAINFNDVFKKLPGVVRFKGKLRNSPGTMFGVELHQNPGFGTCDGTFRNKRYFKCAPDSGVFVGLDKLAPLEDENSKLRTPSKSPESDQDKQPRDRRIQEERLNKEIFARSLSYNVQQNSAMQLDPETGRHTRPHPLDVSPGRTGESEIESTLSQEPSVNVESHREGQQIEEAQGVEVQTTIEAHCGCELDTPVKVPGPGGHPTFGVIRWIGYLPLVKDKLIAGVELEQETLACSDGTFNGTRYFTCQPGRGFFCMLENCRKDSHRTGKDEQFEENASSRQSTSLQQALEDIQQLKNENDRLKLEKCQWEKEKNDVQEEKDEVVVQNNSLQIDLSTKESQVHELETSLTVEDIQQLKNENKRLKLEKCQWEREKNGVQEEKDELVVQNNSLQTDLRTKESQVHELEASLTIAQQALEDIQQLKNESEILKLEKCQWEREKIDVQEEKDELVVQNNSLETDLRTKESQVHELEASLTIAQQALEKMQQLKNESERLKHEKGQWESEKNDVQEEEDELVVQNKNFQTDLRLKESQVHELETSLTIAQQALENIQQLKNENERLKLEKCQWEREKNDVQEEKDELVVQNNSLQTDLRTKESQVHELATSLTIAQKALEDIQQLKNENERLKLEKCQWEREKIDVQEEKDALVVQNNSLQTDLRTKESQVHELATSLTIAQQALEDIQQLKNENERLKLEKCQWEREKIDVQEEKDALVVQNNSLQTDLRTKESQVHELATSLTIAQQALEDIQQLKNENERLKLEKCQWEREKIDVQEEKDELVVQNNSLQTNLRAKEAQVHRLDTTLATAQRALEECQQIIKECCDWVVPRDEVQMTDECLGVGGWGKVVLGTFRGCKVAVKEIHELILSPYNRHLFEREMNIASRCRHPCLLQFIGATNDDGIPLFITELLETSLRALLGQRQLVDTEISIISLDVSLALNYLHNMKPSPVLHRDVSSANVLLWRQGDQWRGKVSDYGTAKFVQQTMTIAPGAVIYSAPEAVSSNQTPKVDVYSFGVLLCEMCVREMPDPKRRNQQVLLVKSHVLRNLVLECLQDNPAERPEMSEIIKEIERFEG